MIKRSVNKLITFTAVAVTLAVLAAPARAQFADGLVAYWSLEGNFEDSINGYHGESSETVDGSDPIAFEPGKFGDAVRLNGENQSIYINGGAGGNDNTIVSPNPEDDGETIENVFDFAFVDGEEGTGTFAMSAWFTVDAFDTSWQALIAKGEGSGWRIHRRGEDAPAEIAYTGGAALPSNDGDRWNADGIANVDPDPAVWHHIVAQTNGALIHAGEEGDCDIEAVNAGEAECLHAKQLWIDGVLVQSAPNARLENRANLMQIGDNPDSATREWEGQIDDVAIWERALTATEIASIYNDGAGNSIGFLLNPGLIGDFNGDEVVDMADFNIMVMNFNTEGGKEQGDINFNGKIDLNDFLAFRVAFAGAGAGAAAAVPEPATLALLGTVAVGLLTRRRRRRR